MRRFRWIAAVAAACAGFVVGVTACGTPGEAPTGPVDWDSALDLGSPGAHAGTMNDVSFYPACGNEVLQADGRYWYPFSPANPDDFPAAPLLAGADGAGATGDPASTLGRVVAPGPGDDIGTLVIFDGGFAYWQSQSGDLETWLTTTEITYQWVC